MKTTLVVCLCLIFVNFGQSQDLDTIIVRNKGMESAHNYPENFDLRGWFDAGTTIFPDDSPPDIIGKNDPYNIKTKPFEGNNFVNLVTRMSGSYEDIGQQLEKPLKENKCYLFSLHLSSSRSFISNTKPDQIRRFFRNPIKLRIKGLNDNRKSVLLTESIIINHQEWKEYDFILKIPARQNLHHLILEAYFGSSKSGFGNLQMDGLSDIYEISCINPQYA